MSLDARTIRHMMRYLSHDCKRPGTRSGGRVIHQSWILQVWTKSIVLRLRDRLPLSVNGGKSATGDAEGCPGQCSRRRDSKALDKEVDMQVLSGTAAVSARHDRPSALAGARATCAWELPVFSCSVHLVHAPSEILVSHSTTSWAAVGIVCVAGPRALTEWTSATPTPIWRPTSPDAEAQDCGECLGARARRGPRGAPELGTGVTRGLAGLYLLLAQALPFPRTVGLAWRPA